MDNASSRARILGLIQTALQNSSAINDTDNDAQPALFVREEGSDIEIFERAFTRLQGNFLQGKYLLSVFQSLQQHFPLLLQLKWYCTYPDILPLLQQAGISLAADIMDAEVAVTGCECLVARTGSVVLSAAQSCGRALPVYAPVHITIARQQQLVYDTDNAIAFLLHKYGNELPSSLHFVAGPSRTGDIEKTLVMGVHGPKDVFVLLLEE